MVKIASVRQFGGFPSGTSGTESTCQCRKHKRPGFDPWVRKIPWSRKWQSAPIFLPGQFHKQRSLAGYTPCGYKESDATEHDFYLTWFFIWFLSYTCELIQIFNYIMCCPINTALQLFYIQPGCQIELNGVFLKPIKLKNIFPWLVFFTYWLQRVCKLRKVVKFIC